MLPLLLNATARTLNRRRNEAIPRSHGIKPLGSARVIAVWWQVNGDIAGALAAPKPMRLD
jgi:hypothetical protein